MELLGQVMQKILGEEESDEEDILSDDGDEFDFVSFVGPCFIGLYAYSPVHSRWPCNADSEGHALDSQAISRVWYELDKAAPKLGELAGTLDGVNMKADDVPGVHSYLTHIRSLESQLQRMALRPELLSLPSASHKIDFSLGWFITCSSSNFHHSSRSSLLILLVKLLARL
jgi:hypothetical protein